MNGFRGAVKGGFALEITRMNWAGIGIRSGDTKIIIDPLMHVNEELFGESRVPFVSLDSFGAVQSVFITHLHSDHFDVVAINEAYGPDVPVYVPLDALSNIRDAGLSNIHGVAIGGSVIVGPFRVISTYSVDGLGDAQCAWVVTEGDKSVFHGGDTLWHGYWRQISANYGPFHAAFLPVNGAVLHEPGSLSSIEAICMTPEQATAAVLLLEADQLIPIHFGSFHNPPNYFETPDCISRLQRSAYDRHVNLLIYEPGDTFTI